MLSLPWRRDDSSHSARTTCLNLLESLRCLLACSYSSLQNTKEEQRGVLWFLQFLNDNEVLREDGCNIDVWIYILNISVSVAFCSVICIQMEGGDITAIRSSLRNCKIQDMSHFHLLAAATVSPCCKDFFKTSGHVSILHQRLSVAMFLQCVSSRFPLEWRPQAAVTWW